LRGRARRAERLVEELKFALDDLRDFYRGVEAIDRSCQAGLRLGDARTHVGT